jgi:hypothetical protein
MLKMGSGISFLEYFSVLKYVKYRTHICIDIHIQLLHIPLIYDMQMLVILWISDLSFQILLPLKVNNDRLELSFLYFIVL